MPLEINYIFKLWETICVNNLENLESSTGLKRFSAVTHFFLEFPTNSSFDFWLRIGAKYK